MRKVLLLQGTIPKYRVPIYNELARNVELTVVYSYGEAPENAVFKPLYVPVKQFHYRVHMKNLYLLAQKYDVVICMDDNSYLYFRWLHRLPRKYKIIFWGIGVSAGYNERFDQNQDDIGRRRKRIENADAMLFYSEYPVEKYSRLGMSREKMFVANNTVYVQPIATQKKDILLFVGSLYKQKKIDILLESYLQAYKINPEIYNLFIVGDGSERETVERWIEQNGLKKKIFLTGAIFEDENLANYFARAIACISPDQAGLSVLKSMGYGVPYITHKDAITGGEIFNISHNENGILLNDFNELPSVILESQQNPAKYILLGEKAKQHYMKHRTVQQMAQGFLDAIGYVTREL